MESISDTLNKVYLPIFKPFLEEFLEKYGQYLLRKPDDFIITNLKESVRLIGLLRTDNRDNIINNKIKEFWAYTCQPFSSISFHIFRKFRTIDPYYREKF